MKTKSLRGSLGLEIEKSILHNVEFKQFFNNWKKQHWRDSYRFYLFISMTSLLTAQAIFSTTYSSDNELKIFYISIIKFNQTLKYIRI